MLVLLVPNNRLCARNLAIYKPSSRAGILVGQLQHSLRVVCQAVNPARVGSKTK